MAKKKVSENVIEVKATTLKEMVSRVYQGVDNNKLLPITQMISIRISGGVLTLTSTDATNYLYVMEHGLDCADLAVVVPADQFSKLIAKMTCESIGLELDNDTLKVTGNGTYYIPLQYDENGKIVDYPNPIADMDFDDDNSIDIKRSTISKVLATLKPALAVTMDEPWYTGYYVGDTMIATNNFLINCLNVPLFDGYKDCLLSAKIVDLLAVMDDENIKVDFIEDSIVFRTADCIVYGRLLDGIEEYAIDDINEYFNIEFPAMCKVGKAELLQVLDRIDLFVTDYEKGEIDLTFTQEGLQIASKSSSGVEVISYSESKNFIDYSCKTEIEMFTKQIKSQAGDLVEIHYGDENVLKLVNDNVTQIIGLLDDSE